MALFAVGSLQAVLIVSDPDANVQPGNFFAVGSYTIEGTVRHANGTAAPNATVILESGGNQSQAPNTTTDATGAYRISGVAIGVYELNTTLDNRTVLVRMMVRADETVHVALPGTATVVRQDHESLAFIRAVLQVCGGILMVLCLVTLLGAIACYRRRAWGLAMTGAITGSLLWLPLSLLLGLIAIVLLTKGRKDFG